MEYGQGVDRVKVLMKLKHLHFNYSNSIKILNPKKPKKKKFFTPFGPIVQATIIVQKY